MSRLLVVEDSQTVLRILQHLATTQLPDVEVVAVTSIAEAKKAVAWNADFFAALVDLHLPDAPNGEVANFTLMQGYPTIVLTGNFDEQRRKSLMESGVVDYVVKESRHAYQYAVKLAGRLLSNNQIKIMVVDDSALSRHHIRALLERHLYRVIEAQDGEEALEQLSIHPDVRLVLTDYEMPNMDGFKLVNEIRRKFDKRGLGIIGLSSVDSGILSARFIKSGANDFLNKPFYPEEFYCRVMQNLEYIELIEEIEEAANRDHLTGLYNRRAFFEKAEALLTQCRNRGADYSFCILDLDLFKRINDDYGHSCGDMVLKRFAAILKAQGRAFLYARVGGEEFALVFAGLDNSDAVVQVDNLRQILVNEPLYWEGQELHTSFLPVFQPVLSWTLTHSITKLMGFSIGLKRPDEIGSLETIELDLSCHYGGNNHGNQKGTRMMRYIKGLALALLLSSPAFAGIINPTQLPFIYYVTIPVQAGQETLQVNGQYRLPRERGGAPIPAVIILHSTGGVDSTGAFYAKALNEFGIATLEIDMWSPRGFDGGSASRPELPQQTVPDAFAALQFLAEKDEIDADKIGVMGFSWGGVVTLLSATGQYNALMNQTGYQFAAHVAHYPICYIYNNPYFPLPGFDLEGLTAPVLIQSGEKDDYDTPEMCPNLVSGLAAADQEMVKLNMYRNAYHGWDRLEPTLRVEDPFAHLGQGGEVTLKPAWGMAKLSRLNVLRHFASAFGMKLPGLDHRSLNGVLPHGNAP